MSGDFEADFKRMTDSKYCFGIKTMLKILLHHQVGFMYWWRSYQKKKSFFKRAILYWYTKKFGLEISTDATIGKQLYLGHPYNITVAGGSVIGEHVSLHKGCTIGRENRGKREGTPNLGNRVWVGINSTIVGNISIGDDVMICPNTFVNFDVPPHSVVLGNPATIHYKENATYKYL